MAPNRTGQIVRRSRVGELEFRLLGPLRVYVDGARVRLGSRWALALLARLLLDANHVVPADRLVADLFGEGASGTAINTLMNALSRLRKALGPDAIFASPAGYELRIDWARTDVYRFEQLASEGRKQLIAGDPGEAAETLRLALNLWRGEPLGELGGEAWARPYIAKLDELRLAALEDQIDAGLALGNPAILAMVERLVEQYPRRGRLRGQLILALDNAGRTTEALTAYQGAVSFFTDVDGGPLRNELRALMLSLPPLIDSLSGELTLDSIFTPIPNADHSAELRIALGGDESSPTTLVDPQSELQPTDVAACLFDDWAFRLGRGEWPDPQTYLQLAGDNADDLRLLMDTYIRALPRPAPAPDDIKRAHAWLAAAPRTSPSTQTSQEDLIE